MGRRIQAETAAIGSAAVDARSVSFFLDGLRCVEERTGGGGGGAATREYVHGVGLDEVLLSEVSQVGTASRVYFHHEDVQGSTVALTDPAGALVDEVAYDEWGIPYFRDPAAHAAAGNPRLFQGHRLDPESGLYYLRARHYDPRNGRFLQRDPLGVWGDPLNLGNPYTFAAHNPVTHGDPLGLMTMVQLGRGFHSAEAEIRSIQDARTVTESSWKFAIGLTFSDPNYIRGVLRQKELEGTKDAFAEQFYAVANSWQFQAGVMALDELDAMTGAVTAATFLRDWATVGLEDATKAAFADEAQLFGDTLTGGDFDNCFLATTPVVAGVETSSGDIQRVVKPIEDVQQDEWVQAKDPRTGEVGWKRVKELHRNWTDEVWYVRVGSAESLPLMRQTGRTERHDVGRAGSGGGEEGGLEGEPPPGSHVVRCTAGHPWGVIDTDGRGRFRYTAALRVGARLDAEPGAPAQVVLGIEVRQEVARTFNFEVEGFHTYYIAGPQGQPGVLVHNISAARLARMKSVARAGRRYASDVEHAATRAAELRAGIGARAGRDIAAVGVARDREGVRRVIIAGRNFGRDASVRPHVRPGEIHIPGRRGLHAEESVEAYARSRGWHLVAEGATIPHCPTRCAPRMDRLGIRMASQRGPITRQLWNETAASLGQ